MTLVLRKTFPGDFQLLQKSRPFAKFSMTGSDIRGVECMCIACSVEHRDSFGEYQIVHGGALW